MWSSMMEIDWRGSSFSSDCPLGRHQLSGETQWELTKNFFVFDGTRTEGVFLAFKGTQMGPKRVIPPDNQWNPSSPHVNLHQHSMNKEGTQLVCLFQQWRRKRNETKTQKQRKPFEEMDDGHNEPRCFSKEKNKPKLSKRNEEALPIPKTELLGSKKEFKRKSSEIELY